MNESNNNPLDISSNFNNSTPFITSEKITISDIPRETISSRKSSNIDSEDDPIKNLQFKPKHISFCKLYYNISNKFDFFLMFIAIISTIIAGCESPIAGYILGDTINELSETVDIDKLPYNEYIIEIKKIEKEIDLMVVFFFIGGLFMFIFNFLMVFLWSYSSLRQMHRFKKNYFELILKQEQKFFDDNNAFEFSTKIQAQLEKIFMGVGDKFGQVVLMISELLSGLLVGFFTSWKLTLILLSSAPILLISFLISDKCAEKIENISRQTYEKAGGLAEELLYNIKTVAAFSNFEYELKKFNDLSDNVEKLLNKKSLLEAISLGLMIVGYFVSCAALVIYASVLILNKEINPFTGENYCGGDVVKIFFSVFSSVFAISNMGPTFEIVKNSCIASSDYFYLLERKPKINLKNSNYIPDKNNFNGKIEFKNVNFSYNENKNILNNLNFIIPANKKIAIVGESGCGKSTIVNLIERLYDINDGEILIDDINIKNYDIIKLRELIGYVQQEPVLFNKSIKENIIFGRKNIDEKMIKEACEDAYINEFIENCDNKYNYIVGIKGGKLSGGQKQRIAIARAILTKPKILILDEATSALDNKSEKEVQKALDNISKKNITVIIIAHRLSTIKNSDYIYAMKNGEILEIGTHDELLKKNGYYASLIKGQMTEKEIKIENKNEINIKNNNNIENDIINIEINEKNNLKNNNDNISNNENKISRKNSIKIDTSRLYSIISSHKSDLILGTISGILYGMCCPITGIVLGNCINSLTHKDEDFLFKNSIKYGLLFVAIGFSGGILLFFKTWSLESIGIILTTKMRKKILKKYLKMHIGFFDIEKNSPGALLTKLSIDTTQLETLILSVLGGSICIIGTGISMISVGLFFDWKITLILSFFLPFIVMSFVTREDYMENSKEENKEIKIEAGSFLSECVINTKTIFSFNFEKSAIEIYSNILENETKDYLKDSLIQGFLIGFGVFINYFTYAVIYKFGIFFIKNKSLSFHNFNIVLANLMNSCDGIGDLLRGMGDIGKAKLSFKSIFEILDTKTLIDPFPNLNEKNNDLNIKGKIEFKNVFFTYPTKPNNLVLNNISFIIEPGKKIGLVGPSGGGKSTIIQLLERFYDVTEGEILIDDINIKNYDLYSLRKKIGLVSQEPVLFKRSLYENILYGNLNSEENEILEAANKAELSNFSREELLNNESNVSGGQKQRFAIARIFLKNPVILLLDEATSALDKETENQVLKSIYELEKGRTSIAIAHRLSSIVNSDEIFVLDKGKIVEKGSHKELIDKKQIYYNLYKYS